MIVTILRHGQAGSAATDAQRKLTATGIGDIQVGAQRLLGHCEIRGIAAPALILHSAWQRTTETAALFAMLFPDAPVDTETALLPGGRVTEVTEAMFQLQQTDYPPAHVVLVSHQPLVSELADYYFGVPHNAPGLPPGGMVCMDMEVPGPGCGKLLFWALPPHYEAGL